MNPDFHYIAWSLRRSKLGLSFILLFSLYYLFGSCGLNASGQTSSSTASGQLEFDVVSIHLVDPASHDPDSWIRFDPDGLDIHNRTAAEIIEFAYDLPHTEQNSLIHGGPKWIFRDSYDLHAKLDQAQATRLSSMSILERHSIIKQLLRLSLGERFGLQTHEEPRLLSVYALITTDDIKRLQTEVPAKTPSDGNAQPSGTIGIADGAISGVAVKISQLVRILNTPYCNLDKLVVDETDLDGTYHIDLRWNPTSTAVMARRGDYENLRPSLPISVFAALEQQLGLKLVSKKHLINTLVVDNIERPTAN